MHIRWRGLELPGSVTADSKTLSSTYGKFVAEPFERGFGTTVGNSLRRVLLSSLEGSAVTQIKVGGALRGVRWIKRAAGRQREVRRDQQAFHRVGRKRDGLSRGEPVGPGNVAPVDEAAQLLLEAFQFRERRLRGVPRVIPRLPGDGDLEESVHRLVLENRMRHGRLPVHMRQRSPSMATAGRHSRRRKPYFDSPRVRAWCRTRRSPTRKPAAFASAGTKLCISSIG